jgi:hypothetical protein
MYHPAAALHNPGLRDIILADFAKLPALADEVIGAPEETQVAKAEQLSMF